MSSSGVCKSSSCGSFLPPEPGFAFCAVCLLTLTDGMPEKENQRFKEKKAPLKSKLGADDQEKKAKRREEWDKSIALVVGIVVSIVPIYLSVKFFIAGIDEAASVFVILGCLFLFKAAFAFSKVYSKMLEEKEIIRKMKYRSADRGDGVHKHQIMGPEDFY